MRISKERLYTIIFEADTPAGRRFDKTLIVVILLSIFFVILESISSVKVRFYLPLKIAEWLITVLFTAEYILRIWVLKKPWKYVTSF